MFNTTATSQKTTETQLFDIEFEFGVRIDEHAPLYL